MPGRFLVCGILVQHNWAPGVTRDLRASPGGGSGWVMPAQLPSLAFHVCPEPCVRFSISSTLGNAAIYPPAAGGSMALPSWGRSPTQSPSPTCSPWPLTPHLNSSIIFLPLPSALLPFHLPFRLPHGLPLIFKCSYSSPSFSGGNFNKCTNICYS